MTTFYQCGVSYGLADLGTSQDTPQTTVVKTETETKHVDIMTRLKPRPK